MIEAAPQCQHQFQLVLALLGVRRGLPCAQVFDPAPGCVRQEAGHAAIELFRQCVQLPQRINGLHDLLWKHAGDGGHDARELRVTVGKVAGAVQVVEEKLRGSAIPRVGQHVAMGTRKAGLLVGLELLHPATQSGITAPGIALCGHCTEVSKDGGGAGSHGLRVPLRSVLCTASASGNALGARTASVQHCATMKRRRLLQLGLGATALLALAGVGVSAWRPGWRDGALSAPARGIFVAVARAVLEGCLPADAAVQRVALLAHLQRLDTSIAGLAPATRGELSDLLAVLGTAAGRRAMTGLGTAWAEASAAEVQQALSSMRTSSSVTRQQVYHALRDLTNAAWFADAGSWDLLGYPGPQTV